MRASWGRSGWLSRDRNNDSAKPSEAVLEGFHVDTRYVTNDCAHRPEISQA